MITNDDLQFLRLAIDISREAREQGNHPFGALLVDPEGAVLIRSGNTVVTSGDLSAHAELNLVRSVAGQYDHANLERCTLYCSTEPCAMCAGAIHWSGIGRVVYGLAQESLYILTSGIPEDRPLRLPCRTVFKAGGTKVAVEGPALEAVAASVHAGFWK